MNVALYPTAVPGATDRVEAIAVFQASTGWSCARASSAAAHPAPENRGAYP
jgi:hypothetical protein